MQGLRVLGLGFWDLASGSRFRKLPTCTETSGFEMLKFGAFGADARRAHAQAAKPAQPVARDKHQALFARGMGFGGTWLGGLCRMSL